MIGENAALLNIQFLQVFIKLALPPSLPNIWIVKAKNEILLLSVDLLKLFHSMKSLYFNLVEV